MIINKKKHASFVIKILLICHKGTCGPFSRKSRQSFTDASFVLCDVNTTGALLSHIVMRVTRWLCFEGMWGCESETVDTIQ